MDRLIRAGKSMLNDGLKRESNKPRALFLHIQKTAGSSIVDLVKPVYGPDEIISHGDYLKAIPKQPIKVIEDGAGTFQDLGFVSGHFGFDFAKQFMNKRYSFTFLRDPIERILSYYYFCKTRNPKEYDIYALAQELTLDEFLMLGLERPAVKACIWNNQAWQLAHGYGNRNGRNILRFTSSEILELAIAHLDEFSYIGFSETFEEDRDHILKQLEIVPPKRKVVSNANPNRATAKDLPPLTLKLLDELTCLDRELYAEAWSKKSSL